MNRRWYHIYVDKVFIETVESTQEMYVVMDQVKEIHSNYKHSIHLIMMGMGENMTAFRRNH